MESKKPYISIPTREPAGEWVYTTFQKKQDLIDFLLPLFKVPGEYDFDSTYEQFHLHSVTFVKKGLFCESPKGSRDYVNFWEDEREKCRKGAIIKGTRGQVWYLPRFYYHWLNFLQIYNKALKKFTFPDVRDFQYHMALYECLAELQGRSIAIVKKRQMASSYFHIAKLYNRYIFEEGFVGKLGASDKKYINNTNGCWKFLNEYHNFTNKNTAWACGNSPDKEFSWQQKVETRTADGRKVEIGTMATISGISFDKDPVSGVGGATDELFYEEGGVAPTADVTYGYMRAALREGSFSTGVFTIAGSVGDLGQCAPLKEFIMNPAVNDFYAVESDLLDENGTIGYTGLFIPEQWGMPPYIDEFGNSLVKEALAYLDTEFARLKLSLAPEKYQLEVSQRPRNLKEAFAMRTVSIFPVQHTTAQVRRIEDNEYPIEHVDLERNEKNEIVIVKSDRQPIKEFPLPMKEPDKKGVICIIERPEQGATYLAAIDPVEVGKTTTSASIASIVVYKMDLEVVEEEYFKKSTAPGKEGVDLADEWGSLKKKEDPIDVKVTSHLEGGKVVCFWAGRYDDSNVTNEHLSRIVELYKAKVSCESNKPGFINYMISKKRQRFLALRNELVFDKDLEVLKSGHQKYGTHMTKQLWEAGIEWAIAFITEVIKEEHDEEGNVIRIHYGVERIPDKMLLKEMQDYQPGGNYDRLVSFILLMGLIRVQIASGLIRKKVNRKNDNLVKPEKLSNFKVGNQLFNNIGMNKKGPLLASTRSRSLFRNMR